MSYSQIISWNYLFNLYHIYKELEGCKRGSFRRIKPLNLRWLLHVASVSMCPAQIFLINSSLFNSPILWPSSCRVSGNHWPYKSPVKFLIILSKYVLNCYLSPAQLPSQKPWMGLRFLPLLNSPHIIIVNFIIYLFPYSVLYSLSGY